MKGLFRKMILSAMLVVLALQCCGAAGADAYGMITPVEAVGGEYHTVVRYSDGTVGAVGDNSQGQCNVSGWSDIVQIAAGFRFTVGLRSDGTVVAAGSNSYGQCSVGRWSGIVQIAAGENHTIGLRSDGTVVAVGDNSSGQCNVSNWRNITQITAAKVNSLGLTRNGQVIIRGAFTAQENYCLSGWDGITHVEAGTGYFIGTRAYGGVIGYGRNTDPTGHGNYEEISVAGWNSITQAVAGRCNAFGLRYDGTVLVSGRNDFRQMDAVRYWSNIVAIGAGVNHVIGIRGDGSVIAAGDNSRGQCDVESLSARRGGALQVAPGTYLNNAAYYSKTGKLWTRSEYDLPYYTHSIYNAPGCWSDTATPGHTAGPVRDNRGNSYSYGMHLDGASTSNYSISFLLGGTCKRFTGVCAYPATLINSQWTPRYTKYFEIYGDGKLLATSARMNSSTGPMPFDVSVAGVNILTITYPATEGPNEAATIFDARVW